MKSLSGAATLRWMPCFLALWILLLSACCMGCKTLDFFYKTPPESVVGAEGSVHSPYAERKCELCHESQNSNRLRMDKKSLCLLCHPLAPLAGRVTHKPVSAGDCCACHKPHKSKYSKLLQEEVSLLCNACHAKESLNTLESHRADGGRACLHCHLPHGSEKDHLLK